MTDIIKVDHRSDCTNPTVSSGEVILYAPEGRIDRAVEIIANAICAECRAESTVAISERSADLLFESGCFKIEDFEAEPSTAPTEVRISWFTKFKAWRINRRDRVVYASDKEIWDELDSYN